MNTKSIVVVLTAILLGTGASLVSAQNEPTKQAQPAAVEVGNTICPVSKEKVGEMGDIVQYEYNGKIYNLCCDACKKDFVKDPQKFAKIAEDEVAASQAVK